MKKIVVIACIHGNEVYGLEVEKMLPPSCSFFVANKKAVEQKKRFIDTDLNRCFPGRQGGNNEEQIASMLIKKCEGYDYVIDLHSTTQECPLFGIITKPNKEKMQLAQGLGLKKAVIMTPLYASGRALIDHVRCGISLEVGPHERRENAEEAVRAINGLQEADNMGEYKGELYEVFDLIKGEIKAMLIRNFQEVKKGQSIAIGKDGLLINAAFDFVAVLVGEKTYNEVICLACKKVT